MPGLIGGCVGERSFGGSQLCLGLELLVLGDAHRHHGGRCLAIGGAGRLPRLVQFRSSVDRLRIARQNERACARLRPQQSGITDLDRRWVGRRNDHAQTELRQIEQMLGEVIGHPDAAVGCRISWQRTAVQRNPRPCQALHVRHEGVVIEV